MSGAIIAPDKLRFTVSMEAEGEKIEINAVMVGRDAYVQDPESGQWFKEFPRTRTSWAPFRWWAYSRYRTTPMRH